MCVCMYEAVHKYVYVCAYLHACSQMHVPTSVYMNVETRGRRCITFPFCCWPYFLILYFLVTEVPHWTRRSQASTAMPSLYTRVMEIRTPHAWQRVLFLLNHPFRPLLERASHCIPGWPQTLNSSTPPPWVLELQWHTILRSTGKSETPCKMHVKIIGGEEKGKACTHKFLSVISRDWPCGTLNLSVSGLYRQWVFWKKVMKVNEWWKSGTLIVLGSSLQQRDQEGRDIKVGFQQTVLAKHILGKYFYCSKRTTYMGKRLKSVFFGFSCWDPGEWPPLGKHMLLS
jgi:hypothetical protein